jgi:ELWxxDGT repeat protein
VIGSQLWFSANGGGATGVEPWRSDGTTAGTRAVADVAAGARNALPLGFRALGDAVLFAADDGHGNERLWARRKDGRVALIGDPLKERLR